MTMNVNHMMSADYDQPRLWERGTQQFPDPGFLAMWVLPALIKVELSDRVLAQVLLVCWLAPASHGGGLKLWHEHEQDADAALNA